ncbi:MAG: site-specific tyrosine recombinase XerC [Gammaproteobacteria bacterium]
MVQKRKQHVLRRKPRMPPRVAPADPARSNPLHTYRAAFSEWSLAAGYSTHTAKTRDIAVGYFIRWADERGIRKPQDITRAILERYQRHLYHYRKPDGAPLSFASQVSRLEPLRAFFKWLARERHILYNPASELEIPRQPRQLPKILLSVAQVEEVLNQPDLETPMGLRNRAILETLYSTGIRRSELVHLKLYDVDLERGTLMVRQGKGRKDRLIPIGERACAWIRRYRDEVRPSLVMEPDHGHLFVTDYGEPFERNRLSDLVRRYMRHAGFSHGSCHAFRHACATHMLENGADIRYIQALLGHSELSTTQIYTQVSIGKLKEIHAATHPARLERARAAGKASTSDGDRRALLNALQAESEDDWSPGQGARSTQDEPGDRDPYRER